MMISAEGYVLMHKDDTFEELIAERDSLMADIKAMEAIVYSDDKSGEGWNICPGPDVVYQMDLEYLAELCLFIRDKYNTEIVWGDDEEEEYADTAMGVISIVL